MSLLTPILIIPLAAALLCLLVRWRRLMEWINILAFAATLALGIRLFHEVLARTVVTEWKEFFYADALSAWMVLLISAVNTAITGIVALLYVMARDGELPDTFLQLNRFGVPWVPLITATVLPVVVLALAALVAAAHLYLLRFALG